MFRFHKTLDVVTLFSKASQPASIRAHTLLKQLSANASEYATEDQASDHTHQSSPKRSQFELDVTEEAPTDDQLKNILDYLGPGNAGLVIKGAKNDADAIRKLKANTDSFERPVTVDWSNGKAVVGDKESEILKMIEALPQI